MRALLLLFLISSGGASADSQDYIPDDPERCHKFSEGDWVNFKGDTITISENGIGDTCQPVGKVMGFANGFYLIGEIECHEKNGGTYEVEIRNFPESEINYSYTNADFVEGGRFYKEPESCFFLFPWCWF